MEGEFESGGENASVPVVPLTALDEEKRKRIEIERMHTELAASHEELRRQYGLALELLNKTPSKSNSLQAQLDRDALTANNSSNSTKSVSLSVSTDNTYSDVGDTESAATTSVRSAMKQKIKLEPGSISKKRTSLLETVSEEQDEENAQLEEEKRVGFDFSNNVKLLWPNSSEKKFNDAAAADSKEMDQLTTSLREHSLTSSEDSNMDWIKQLPKKFQKRAFTVDEFDSSTPESSLKSVTGDIVFADLLKKTSLYYNAEDASKFAGIDANQRYRLRGAALKDVMRKLIAQNDGEAIRAFESLEKDGGAELVKYFDKYFERSKSSLGSLREKEEKMFQSGEEFEKPKGRSLPLNTDRISKSPLIDLTSDSEKINTLRLAKSFIPDVGSKIDSSISKASKSKRERPESNVHLNLKQQTKLQHSGSKANLDAKTSPARFQLAQPNFSPFYSSALAQQSTTGTQNLQGLNLMSSNLNFLAANNNNSLLTGSIPFAQSGFASNLTSIGNLNGFNIGNPNYLNSLNLNGLTLGSAFPPYNSASAIGIGATSNNMGFQKVETSTGNLFAPNLFNSSMTSPFNSNLNLNALNLHTPSINFLNPSINQSLSDINILKNAHDLQRANSLNSNDASIARSASINAAAEDVTSEEYDSNYDEDDDKNNLQPRRWTQKEDVMLLQSVKRNGAKNWKKIAQEVPGRNHVQCLQRWRKALDPTVVKGHWSPEEDAQLLRLVQENPKNWGHVARGIDGRTAKQCRERYHNHLDPRIRKGNWTLEEDKLIVTQQKHLGNKWADIAKLLPGRTENSVKIRWKSIQRQINSANFDTNPSSPQSAEDANDDDEDEELSEAGKRAHGNAGKFKKNAMTKEKLLLLKKLCDGEVDNSVLNADQATS